MVARTMPALLRSLQQRMTSVERRLARGSRSGIVVDPDWTDLTDFLAPGISYTPDAAPGLDGIKARRVGWMVELSLGNFSVDSINVPLSGNIANRDILQAIPSRLCPAGGAAVSAAWNGRLWSGYIDEFGTVMMAAVTPNANATGAQTITGETFSGTAVYPAGNL